MLDLVRYYLVFFPLVNFFPASGSFTWPSFNIVNCYIVFFLIRVGKETITNLNYTAYYTTLWPSVVFIFFFKNPFYVIYK